MAARFGLASAFGEGTRMPGPGPSGALDVAIHRLRELALRRHAGYLELRRNGRWRHYFTEAEFAECLRDVVALRRRWDALAGVKEPVMTADSTKSAA
jgi:hypothetical protein